MLDKVTRLRQLMSEAIPRQSAPPRPEQAAAQAFAFFDFNTTPVPTLDTSPRAKQEREIARIATWYGWGNEIARALDKADVASLSGLNDDQANGLLERLQQLENCAQEGLDCPDAPPAR